MKTCLVMTLAEAQPFLKKVNGSGGYQSLLRRMQANTEVVITVTKADLHAMGKMASYTPSGFKGRVPK